MSDAARLLDGASACRSDPLDLTTNSRAPGAGSASARNPDGLVVRKIGHREALSGYAKAVATPAITTTPNLSEFLRLIHSTAHLSVAPNSRGEKRAAHRGGVRYSFSDFQQT
jgi:hypothetical protein